MTVSDIVAEIEAAGVAFRLDGEEVRIVYPDAECREGLSGKISLLRGHREEVAAYLKSRGATPLIAQSESGPWFPYRMPADVRLVHWEPKVAPLAIDVCTIAIDLPKFIQTELAALDSRLNNPWTIHGGFTVPQILDRLAQAGLIVTIDVSLEEKPMNTTEGLDPEACAWVERMIETSLDNLRRQGTPEAKLEIPRAKLREVFEIIARHKRKSAAGNMRGGGS